MNIKVLAGISLVLMWALSGGVHAQDALKNSLQSCMACHGVEGAFGGALKVTMADV